MTYGEARAAVDRLAWAMRNRFGLKVWRNTWTCWAGRVEVLMGCLCLCLERGQGRDCDAELYPGWFSGRTSSRSLLFSSV